MAFLRRSIIAVEKSNFLANWVTPSTSHENPFYNFRPITSSSFFFWLREKQLKSSIEIKRASLLTFDVELDGVALPVALLVVAHASVQPRSGPRNGLQHQALVAHYRVSLDIVVKLFSLKEEVYLSSVIPGRIKYWTNPNRMQVGKSKILVHL